MKRWTQGKWEYFRDTDVIGVNDSIQPEACDGFRTVCRLEFSDYELENDTEKESNARLITNAPEMFAMLNNMIRLFDRNLPPDSIGANQCQEAKNLINKIIG